MKKSIVINSMAKKVEKKVNVLEILDTYFKTQFGRLGVTIGKHPRWFLVVPVIISLVLGSGLLQLNYTNDPEYLFAPFSGKARNERKIIEQAFPANYSSKFNPSRIVHGGRVAKILVTTKDDGNLLRSEIWREIVQLDEFVRSVSVIHDGREYNYSSLCAKWNGACFENDILTLADSMDSIEAQNSSLDYPFMLNPATLKTYIFPYFFGGIRLSNENSTVDFVRACVLLYFANIDPPHGDEIGYKWEGALLKALNKQDPLWKSIDVYRITWRTIGEEVDQNLITTLKFVPLAVGMATLFAAMSVISRDSVRSKPWLGFAGMLTTSLGALAGFGLTAFLGVPLISINIAGVFLSLGIGIDDSFVMLAAWRRTSVKDPVPKRMGEAFSDAGVSITITSLTDMFSFWVGAAAPFHSVRIFSLYTGAAVVGTYLFHITMFGAALALSGYHEAERRHGVFFWRPVETPSSKPSTLESVATAKPVTENNNQIVETTEFTDEAHEFGLMAFFRDTWAYYLNKPLIKGLILLLFCGYLGLAAFGISQMEEGLALGKLSMYGSYAQKYFQLEDELFRKFPYRIQVVITGDVDYSNVTVQSKIERMMRQFEESRWVGPEGAKLTESWLRSFLKFALRLKSIDLDLNLTSKAAFAQSLRESYLGPTSIFSEDVKFNEDGTKIIASRFVIQSTNVKDSIEDSEMVKELRAIGEEQAPDLNVTLFNYQFIFFDQYLTIRSTTLKSVLVTGVIMMLLSLVFIPNPLCSLWVAFSIVSIVVGVGGLLVLWNVNLDVVSMLCLIMCIGLSVDFSVHISYAYISSKAETPSERVVECLQSLGTPILQGAISTLLGISIIFFPPSYILSTFSKSITLVMIVSAAHGLLLLPVLLSIFGPGSCKSRKVRVEPGLEFQEMYRKNLGFDNPVFVPSEFNGNSIKVGNGKAVYSSS